MIVAEVGNRGAAASRAGTEALSLLATPINSAVLEALTKGPRALGDLRRDIDSPPQTTMRAHLRSLALTGVVERHRRNEFPGNVEYELAEGGRRLLTVAAILADWLRAAPESPPALGSGAARSAIKALIEGWTTSMVRALATHPLTLTELDSEIASVSYPSLERRLGAMRQEGLIEPLSTNGRGTPYGVSDWLRAATAPLIAAARWERAQLRDEAPPITDRDVEAVFLLALPLLKLRSRPSVSCRLAVNLDDGDPEALSGTLVTLRQGEVETCETRLEGNADSWALGPPEAWFAAVIEGDVTALSFGGKTKVAKELIAALHAALFRAAPKP